MPGRQALGKGSLFNECQFVALGTEAAMGPTGVFFVECRVGRHSAKSLLPSLVDITMTFH